MNKKQQGLTAALFVLFSLSPVMNLQAVSQVTVRLHFALTETAAPAPPEVIDNHLVLTYKGERPYRFVGAAFKHENFTTIHPFYRNPNGVYILAYPLDQVPETIDYRIVADGLWMFDPQNSTRVKAPDGVYFSRFVIPKEFEKMEFPEIKADGIKFKYLGSQGQRVFVYGDFNNWDPFMFELKEKNSGSYETQIRLPKGEHKYRFIVNGTPIPDPRNDNKKIDSSGVVSIIRF